MKLVWVALAAVLLAGCAVVPAPYPYDPYVAAPSTSLFAGTPAFIMVSLAVILSPMELIISGVGPMNFIP